MSHDSYLCGLIKVESPATAAGVMQAVSRLPENAKSDTWPNLSAAMFAHTPHPAYRDEIVHFAASYKDILGSWKAWEAKFLALLAGIAFSEAKVLLEDCYRGDVVVTYRRDTRSGAISRQLYSVSAEPLSDDALEC